MHLSGISVPITTAEPLNHVYMTILKFVYFLFVNNDKYLSYVVDNNIFGISIPDFPSSNVETTFLRQFCICLHFCRKQQQIFIIC